MGFPNKMVLELTCKVNETIKALYKKVEHVVSTSMAADGTKLTQFYLYDAPPIRKFAPNSKRTLGQEGLVPGANIKFGIANQNPPYPQEPAFYLKPEFLAQLPPAPPEPTMTMSS